MNYTKPHCHGYIPSVGEVGGGAYPSKVYPFDFQIALVNLTIQGSNQSGKGGSPLSEVNYL